ncbi:hypothetical protein J4423_03770 [Candidatus Pacearchaeota archaeon]|nr:hypothetical protein [Candidatus Pacearchaeota archaeon]
MNRVAESDRLDSLVNIRFPRKIDYSEFVKMFEFIDKIVFPCEVEYSVKFNGKIGQRDEESGETLAHHKYVEKAIHGTIRSLTDRTPWNRDDFSVIPCNDCDDDYLTKTRFVSLRFYSGVCGSIDELGAMKSVNIEVMQRTKAGIEVYFAEHPGSK